MRGISLKLQEEERERRLDFVPEVTFDTYTHTHTHGMHTTAFGFAPGSERGPGSEFW